MTGSWPELPLWMPVSVLGYLGLQWVLVLRHLRALEPLPDPIVAGEEPAVCVCIPARNEGSEIGAALDSWMAQTYTSLRVVVVDDASTDDTPDLLRTRASLHANRLEVIRNETLPEGWLGKNHALHRASSHPWAQAAEHLVFADADVRVAPDLLRRAAAWVLQEKADVLALVPGVEAKTFWERLFVPAGATTFMALISPRRVANPKSRAACGVGGFTWIRREAYTAIGGHAAAPMEVVDDMLLAYRAKQAGFINHVAQGGPDVRLRMYRGGRDLLAGIRKNILGFHGYWPWMVLGVLAACGVILSPIWLALGGWPGAALTAWLMVPPLVTEVDRRFTLQPADLTLAWWPLMAIPVLVALVWATRDRLWGVNRWRGRTVRVRT